MAYLTPQISHTYPAHHTYPTHIHSKRIPPIRFPPVRIHAMRIHSKGCQTYRFKRFASAGFVIRIPPITTHIPHISSTSHIPHISNPNVSHPYVPHQYVSHQYVSVQQHVSMLCVSIPKWCISRNRKRIPPIHHIPPIRIFTTYPTSTDPLNAYPFKKFASAGMAMSMSILASLHFISYHCYSAGIVMNIETLLILQCLCNIILNISVSRAYEHGIHR